MLQGESPNKVVFSPKGFFIAAYADTRALEAYATFKKVWSTDVLSKPVEKWRRKTL